MLNAVSGFTKQEAACCAVVPLGNTSASTAFATLNCEYIEPLATATSFPMSACAAGDDPALTTVPAPSLPTGMDSSKRALNAGIARSRMLAVRTGLAVAPDCFAVFMSTGPRSRAMSDGLIGVASTRITISSAAGSGVGTETSETSRTPDFLTRDLICRPVSVFDAMVLLLPRGQEI